MNKTSVKSGEIDIEAFDRAVKQDHYSMAALVLKIRNSKLIANLPDLISKYNVPPGTIPCPETPAKCLALLVKMQRANKVIHPVHELDVITTANNVVITPKGVTYAEGSKTISVGVSCGYLLTNMNDSLRIIHANTAEVVATDGKCNKKGDVVRPEWPENYCVVVSNSAVVRPFCETKTASKSKARDEIYEFLMRENNRVFGVRYHSTMAIPLDNYTPHAVMERALRAHYLKKGKPMPDEPTRIVGVSNAPVPCSSNIAVAYRQYFRSMGIRGGRNGRSISHGFERFSMSKTMANNLNLVHDFLNMAELYGHKTVLIRDSATLTVEQMRILVFNGFRIVAPYTYYQKCKKNSPAGVYSSNEDGVKMFEFLAIADTLVKPSFSEDVVTMGKYYDEALSRVAKMQKGFSYVYLDSRLISRKNEFSYLPSTSADNMQIIVARGLSKTYAVESHIKRCSMATSCRNRFLTSRKPFCTMDIMADFVKWDRELKYPALQVATAAKVLDLELAAVGDNLPKFVPLEVNEEHFRSVVVEVESQENLIPDLFVEIVQTAPRLLFFVYFAYQEDADDKFKYLEGNNYEDWDDKYDPLLQLSSAELERLIASVDDNGQLRDLYDSVFTELVGTDGQEEVVGDEDVEADPVVVPQAPVMEGAAEDDEFDNIDLSHRD